MLSGYALCIVNLESTTYDSINAVYESLVRQIAGEDLEAVAYQTNICP